MKKAKVVELHYHCNDKTDGKYTLQDLMVYDCKGEWSNLSHYKQNDWKRPYRYDSLALLIRSVLSILKYNNYYVSFHTECGARFYNIYTYNLDDANAMPTRIGLTGWSEKE